MRFVMDFKLNMFEVKIFTFQKNLWQRTHGVKRIRKTLYVLFVELFIYI